MEWGKYGAKVLDPVLFYISFLFYNREVDLCTEHVVGLKIGQVVTCGTPSSQGLRSRLSILL